MATVYIGLGSNLGDRDALLSEAIRRLGVVVDAIQCSPRYETEPVGYLDQPRFLNAVLRGVTRLAPLELLHRMQAIEQVLGRERPFQNAPRTIDLDLLLYDDVIRATPELTIPHPRMHERPFVLVPLTVLAPHLRDPVSARAYQELVRELGPVQGMRRLEE